MAKGKQVVTWMGHIAALKKFQFLHHWISKHLRNTLSSQLLFRKQKTLQPKEITDYLEGLLRDHKASKEGLKLSNNELAPNAFPTQCQFLWKWLMCPFHLNTVWNATARRNIKENMEIDHNWVHNLIYNTIVEREPCLKLSNDFQGWMGTKKSL